MSPPSDFSIHLSGWCTRCDGEVDVDVLEHAERALSVATDSGGVFYVDKPGACSHCGGSRVVVKLDLG